MSWIGMAEMRGVTEWRDENNPRQRMNRVFSSFDLL